MERLRSLSVIFAVLLVLALLTPYIKGQVTFSRDWNAGKRSIDGATSECPALWRTVLTMCNAILKNVQPGRIVAVHTGPNDEIESVFANRM